MIPELRKISPAPPKVKVWFDAVVFIHVLSVFGPIVNVVPALWFCILLAPANVILPFQVFDPVMFDSAPWLLYPVPDRLNVSAALDMFPDNPRVPPLFTVVPLPVPPSAAAFADSSTPPLIVVVPPYVFAPENLVVPVPFTVTLKLPVFGVMAP